MTTIEWDTAWINARIMTCEKDTTVIENAAIATLNGQICWIGSTNELQDQATHRVIDVENRLITPGLIDCHTHLIYGGNRADEFAMRLSGASYSEIAKAGGGIQSTVTKTRAASLDTLLADGKQRATECMSNGITTLEIKSGYGLDLETELNMLRVARKIGDEMPLRVQKTFLGAHTIPKEYHGRADDYIRYVCNEMLPIIADEKLADAVDIFCEHIAFNLDHATQLFERAKKYGLPVKCHAEQLSASGAAKLAAKYNALSVDHLEYLNDDGVKAIAASGAVAVLLPGAYYFLRENHLPPIALLRHHQVPIAIASDHNPGTSPILSLLTIMNMAATLFRLTPDEIFLGVTKHAASALGLLQQCGTLTVGKSADMAIWNIESPIELIYYIKQAPLWQHVLRGNISTS